ncbi:PAS domain-containing sensor histidine kinase [Halobacteria archaeon AArc-curdl1]|uniref:histidine kinase n=1 Tax=Natronosalvus hydrolyticus TaxID=2979988 RepID=A0AAP2Z8G7_9EURY|nr:PAS domain-containing sensor histidine kinase [Halobacteria archaeon AArc-curdl1]
MVEDGVGNQVAGAVTDRGVTLVGFGLIGATVAYALFASGPTTTLVLELVVPVSVAIFLLWYGQRDSLSAGKQRLIAATAFLSALASVAISLWITYLYTLRFGQTGEPTQILLTATSIGLGVGTVLGHVYVDFSRHYRAHERLSQAVDASNDGIAIFDEHRHRYVNDAYTDLYGIDRSLEYTPWDALYTNAACVRIEREVFPALEERSSWRGTLTGIRQDGTTFPQDVTVSTLEDGYVVIVRDISEQRDREQRIQVLNRVLRHNLRNAFTVIQGHANMIADQDADLERTHVEPIRHEIADLLATADKARGVERTLERRSDRSLIEPSKAVRSAADRATAAYPGAQILTHVEESDAPTVDGSIVDALHELVDNAVEHHHETNTGGEDGLPLIPADATPTVEIGVQSVDYDGNSRLEFTVSDDGPGIPETERQAVLNGEETQLDHGSGLGLWLVTWIVTNAGGDLRFSDRPEGGSIVTLSFPLEGSNARGREPDRSRTQTADAR